MTMTAAPNETGAGQLGRAPREAVRLPGSDREVLDIDDHQFHLASPLSAAATGHEGDVGLTLGHGPAHNPELFSLNCVKAAKASFLHHVHGIFFLGASGVLFTIRHFRLM